MGHYLSELKLYGRDWLEELPDELSSTVKYHLRTSHGAFESVAEVIAAQSKWGKDAAFLMIRCHVLSQRIIATRFSELRSCDIYVDVSHLQDRGVRMWATALCRNGAFFQDGIEILEDSQIFETMVDLGLATRTGFQVKAAEGCRLVLKKLSGS